MTRNDVFAKWALRALIGLVATIALAYASQVDTRVEKVEDYQLQHAEEFGGVKSDVKHIKETVDRIEDKLDS